jgi:hypothetical protein
LLALVLRLLVLLVVRWELLEEPLRPLLEVLLVRQVLWSELSKSPIQTTLKHSNFFSSQDDTFKKSADLGGILGNIVVGSMKAFTSTNNQLMHGDKVQNDDIQAYVKEGAFVNFGGVDKNAVIDMMNNFMVGNAINLLWRTQKIFIMGGGACSDGQGIGNGPKDYSVCRDGKAWYLYYWQENDVISTTSHQWGWVATPPGGDQLGKGDWTGVTVQVSIPRHVALSLLIPT